MEKERLNDAIGLGLAALLAGVYVFDYAKRKDEEKELAALGQKEKSVVNKKKRKIKLFKIFRKKISNYVLKTSSFSFTFTTHNISFTQY